VAAIQEPVTAVLRSIPKEAFADSFHKLYERCQQYIVKDGDYFEVNLFVSSVLLVFWYHSPNFLVTPRINVFLCSSTWHIVLLLMHFGIAFVNLSKLKECF
jgi:hypothetical protein